MANLSSFPKVCEQFKFSELNKHQKEAIISAVLKNKDVFVSLPTGFGKSVIFQALPLVFDGFTGDSGHIVIVVSPLPTYLSSSSLVGNKAATMPLLAVLSKFNRFAPGQAHLFKFRLGCPTPRCFGPSGLTLTNRGPL